MFLHLLNQKEKEYFLELAYLVAKADNDFAEEEKTIIQQYRIEMNLDVSIYQTKELTLEKIVNFFKDSLRKIQKVTFLEIYALTLCDNIFRKEEEKILINMQKEFSISNSDKEKTLNIIKNLQEIYTEANDVINS
jgi:hypothetical protein